MRKRISAKEWALRTELAAAYNVFAAYGWTHLIHTHITVKLPSDGRNEELFLINPFGLLWDEITASSIIKVKADGEIVDPGSTNSKINPAGFKIHSAIHTSLRGQKEGDISWIMHIHVNEVVAIATLKKGLIRGLSQYAMDLGGISYHNFEHATSQRTDVCQKLVDDLGPKNKVLLLRNHGAITVGKSVNEAFFLTYQLIESCKVQLFTLSAAKNNNDYSIVPDETVESTFKIVQNQYTGDAFGKLEWEAARRKMEKMYGKDYQL